VGIGRVTAMIRHRFMGLWHMLSLLGDGIEAIPVRRPTVLGAANHRGRSSAAAPDNGCLVAHQGSMRPPLSGALGLKSSRPSSILTTPSCPSRAAH